VSTTLERLQQLFLAHFDYKIEQLTATTTLQDLNLDSLDIIEFMFDIENEFNIKIPDQEFRVRTIQDMVDSVDRFVSVQNIGAPSHH
jgi:acyl carrier protein